MKLREYIIGKTMLATDNPLPYSIYRRIAYVKYRTYAVFLFTWSIKVEI